MSQTTETPTSDNAAECLRLALPQMSSRSIPVTPENYAVWYAFVCGENDDLNSAIAGLDRTGAKYTAEENRDLFVRFVSECDIVQFTKVRAEMDDILRELGTSLGSAGNEARSFSGTLESTVVGVEQSRCLEDIRGLLVTLVAETRSMQESNERMLEQFESKSREIELLQEELQRERKRATSDPLTGLANRAALFDGITACVAEAQDDSPPSLLMVDIDHFKQVNDNFGHLIGDRVIRYVGQVLKSNIKGRDLAARFGGEEFAVLLPATSIPGARAVAETMRHTVANAQLVRSETKKSLGRITVSVGVARYRTGEDIMDFINRADQALYAAKRAGRNRVALENEVGLSSGGQESA